jgi:hypothetical protein
MRHTVISILTYVLLTGAASAGQFSNVADAPDATLQLTRALSPGESAIPEATESSPIRVLSTK